MSMRRSIVETTLTARPIDAVARTVPAAPSPQDGDLASFTTLRAYLEKYGGAGPEAYLRTRYRTNPDGSVGGLWAPDASIRQAMIEGDAGRVQAVQP